MAKADRIVNFVLPGPLLSLDTHSERHNKGGTIRGKGEPGMAVIFGLGGPFILLQTDMFTPHSLVPRPRPPFRRLQY